LYLFPITYEGLRGIESPSVETPRLQNRLPPILQGFSFPVARFVRNRLGSRIDLAAGEALAGVGVILPPAGEQVDAGSPRLVAASRKSQVIAKHGPEVRVRALINDVLRAPPRRADFRIERESLFRNHAVDVVLRMIDVADVRHHAADKPAVFEAPHRWRVHNAQVGMAEEIAAAAETIHHPGTIHMR